jgi:glutamine cyclotransferase
VYNQKKHILQHALTLLLVFFCIGAQAATGDSAKYASSLGFKVVSIFQHNAALYTEGLVFHDGKLLESAGEYGESAIYEIDIASGKILRSRKVDPQFFAEGIAVAHGRIVQLTWREQTAFVYDLAFNPITTLSYNTEGWGLASLNDEQQLVMSDGTPILRFLDADDYHFLRQITVHDGDKEVMRLNELEVANGLIYANVWLTDRIAVIDPADGRVVNWLDMSSLQTLFRKTAKWDEVDNVLNGIAYDPRNGHFYVTGKRWPVLFEIQIDSPQRKSPSPAIAPKSNNK